MKAFVIDRITRIEEDPRPLGEMELPEPIPREGEIVIRLRACGVCHTELDEIEGRTPPPELPVVPGHQAVGVVAATGPGADRFRLGERVGVGWIYSSCGRCPFCLSGRENLCPSFLATGRDRHGGYAPFMKVHQDYAFPIPDALTDAEAAPLLCAGAIGYRSLTLAGLTDGGILGLTGFGASGHLVLKMASHLYPKSPVFVFARRREERRFALELGAAWAGETADPPPEPMDAVIDTTPAWMPVVKALGGLKAGGRLVINAIRKEEADKSSLEGVDYPSHLWMEKEIKSVANVTRRDIAEMLRIASEIPIKPAVREYHFHEANQALRDLRQKGARGAKVLVFP
ncbi:MAG TPA: zinc-dependent alcohol dehydrogenase family protein [Syntrophales bacterium]|nr:zinc-dependent alcohol dehydrogenase family protein [Syntrophales bacterium]HON99144.1 zinc-dependent alcohol dehydrogenase family protein [Syntrophales bacterium]HPC00252.1 zinc-dependent alcohol dehydrogenase family protein [Syntrophales bacterium]HRS86202.1 zinc-dependent alcohol dehydrogenase family protein [Syntrophales bacterium]